MFLDRFHDAVPAAADGRVLEFHDCTCTERVIGVEISSEGRDGRHAYDYFVDFVIFPGPHHTFDDCGTDFVAHRVLGIISCCDEELVFDVNEVLTVVDYFDIGVCNRVLCVINNKPFAGI